MKNTSIADEKSENKNNSEKKSLGRTLGRILIGRFLGTFGLYGAALIAGMIFG